MLSLSAKRPHKNLLALIGAVAQIPGERRPLLVLPGYATDHEAQLRERARALGVGQDVRFLGWLPGEELEGLWQVADAFVYPVAVRGLRPAGARGDGSGRSGGLREHLLAAGGRGRRGAAVRPP